MTKLRSKRRWKSSVWQNTQGEARNHQKASKGGYRKGGGWDEGCGQEQAIELEKDNKRLRTELEETKKELEENKKALGAIQQHFFS